MSSMEWELLRCTNRLKPEIFTFRALLEVAGHKLLRPSLQRITPGAGDLAGFRLSYVIIAIGKRVKQHD